MFYMQCIPNRKYISFHLTFASMIPSLSSALLCSVPHDANYKLYSFFLIHCKTTSERFVCSPVLGLYRYTELSRWLVEGWLASSLWLTGIPNVYMFSNRKLLFYERSLLVWHRNYFRILLGVICFWCLPTKCTLYMHFISDFEVFFL